MKWTMNLKDKAGCIRTGYESVIEAETLEEAKTEYLYGINILQGITEITEEDVDYEKEADEQADDSRGLRGLGYRAGFEDQSIQNVAARTAKDGLGERRS